MSDERHILRLGGGVRVELAIDDAGHIESSWVLPQNLTREKVLRILKRYESWRNEIVNRFSQRTGRQVMIIDDVRQRATIIDGTTITTKKLDE